MITVYSLLGAMALIFFLLGYLLHAFYGNRSRLSAIRTALDGLMKETKTWGSFEKSFAGLPDSIGKVERQLERTRGDIEKLHDSLETLRQESSNIRSVLQSQSVAAPGTPPLHVSPGSRQTDPVVQASPETAAEHSGSAAQAPKDEPAQPWRKSLNSILESIEDGEDR